MTEAGSLVTSLTGWELLADPLLNKGTAFSEAERDALGLHGLLPPHIGTLEEQVSRRLTVLRRFASDLERYAFLSELHDNNETLFFALLEQNLEELLPLVYTPTVGAGCQQFSQLFRKPRGRFSMIGCPVWLSDSPFQPSRAPLKGEHTEDVLKNITGYTQDEIRQLRGKRVICENAARLAHPIGPFRPFTGEREGPIAEQCEGEAGAGRRSGIPHLTPPSPPAPRGFAH